MESKTLIYKPTHAKQNKKKTVFYAHYEGHLPPGVVHKPPMRYFSEGSDDDSIASSQHTMRHSLGKHKAYIYTHTRTHTHTLKYTSTCQQQIFAIIHTVAIREGQSIEVAGQWSL
uniref:Uncharacterized protein n=1 Tax=Anopheles gambiae TaxID=7165 RepID=A0A0E4G8C3_ANOGA